MCSFVCVETGAVYASGMNSFGQLGTGAKQEGIKRNFEPSLIELQSRKAKQISCGLMHSHVLLGKSIESF